MTLHSPKSFDRFVLALKGGSVVEQWGSHVGKVGGKVFVLCGDGGEDVAFKVSEMSFEGLTAIEGISQAPYFAKRQWVSVAKGALSEADLRAYVMASYRTVAAKLTRKARAEFGIEL
jgi:predicted DNA-binding protein (MmcQ/YjbR family)